MGRTEDEARAQRLALIRERLHGGISQRAFAERLGVSQARYNHWERGLPIPTDQVRKIKDITPGITADWLYWGDISGLNIETLRKLQSLPHSIDRRRLNQLKKACSKADETDDATNESVLGAIRAAVPDATSEEISALIEELGNEGERALRLSKLLKDK